MTMWLMFIASWIPKATNTHTHTPALRLGNTYALPLHQQLHECASILRYTYIASPVIFVFIGTETKIPVASHARDIGVYFPGLTVVGGM